MRASDRDYPDYGADSGDPADAILDTQHENAQLWNGNRRLKAEKNWLLCGLVVMAFLFIGLFLWAMGAGLYAAAIISGFAGIGCLVWGIR